MEPTRPPRDNVIRAVRDGIELREAADGGTPTLVGHLGVFNQWTKIQSSWEGTFMERVAPGSFTKTFIENRAAMRVTLNHGGDPELGDKVLGPIEELREDATGGYYEVPLFRGIPELVMEGLRHGQYGASWRASVMKEDFIQRTKPSDYNPDALPERTIKELRLMEFGPVTFPAYLGATAGIRSLTDDFIFRQLMGDPEKLRQLLAHYADRSIDKALAEASAAIDEALPVIGAESSHSDEKKEAAPVAAHVQPRFHNREDFHKWLASRI